VKRLIFALACISAPLSLAQNGYAPVTANRVLGPIDDTQRIPLRGNVHPMARQQFDWGAAPLATPTGRISLVLLRSQAQQRDLTQYLADVQNPGSSSYHKWLTPTEYGARFGLSDSDMMTVEGWLEAHGFKIERVPAARNVIEFSGTLDQVQNTFHTAIHTFRVNGETHLANVSDPEIPAALAPVVAGVGPLHDFRPKPMMVRGPQGHYDAQTHRITPNLTLGNATTKYLFVDPADAAIIYNTPNKALNPNYSGTTYDGTGVSIGIVGVSDLTMADVQNYRTAFLGEVPGAVNLPKEVVDGTAPGLNGAGTEAVLDNEIAGGIAPKASVYFYTSADTGLSSGLFNAIYRAVGDNTVSILSVSFGECEAALGTAGNQILFEVAEQAAAQGITLTVSSGDNGSAGCDDFETQQQATRGFGVNGFASTPYNVAVGGTDFDVLSSSFATYANQNSSGTAPYYQTALKYIPENPWNDSTSVNGSLSGNVVEKDSNGNGNIVAGSGGLSTQYSKPAFQSSLTPKDGKRDLPDVSLLAGNGLYHAAWVLCSDNVTDGSPQGYNECWTTNGQFDSNTVFGGVGGTSASAPAFAGMMALVAQAHGAAADNYRLGQVNNILYQLAQSKYATVFHDVTKGNISVACTTGSPNCGTNGFLTGYDAETSYDLATGLGSVDAAAMVHNWTSVSLAPTTTSLKINGSAAAYSGVHGASLKFDVNVTPGSATGVAAVVDDANPTAAATAKNGQIGIPLAGGTGSVTFNGLPGGNYTVWARYGGDSGNATSVSTPPIGVTIAPEDSTTMLTAHAYDRTTGKEIPLTDMPLGSLIQMDAQVEGAAEGSATQGVATGNLNFMDNGVSEAVQAVNSANQSSWPSTLNRYSPGLGGGQHQLTASYSGDASFNASASVPISVSVARAPSQITVDKAVPSRRLMSYSTGYAWIGGTLYSDAFPGVSEPSGTISLLQDNAVIATGGVGGGDGTLTKWILDATVPVQSSVFHPGLNAFTLRYEGDASYLPSSDGSLVVDYVAPGGGMALTTPPSLSVSPGNTLTTAITLTPSGGYTGQWQLTCDMGGDQNLFSCVIPQTHVPVSGPADSVIVLYTNSNTPPGNYSLRVRGYDDNNGYPGENTIDRTIPVTVNAGAPALTLMKNGLLNVAPGATGGNTTVVSIIPSAGMTGQVNLSCAVTTEITDPQSAPTCTVPASVTLDGTTPAVALVQAVTTPATTAGAYTVTVTATSVANSAVSTTGTIPLMVTPSQSLSLSTVGALSLSVGTTTPNAATLTIYPMNGDSGTASLSCFVQAAFPAAGSNLPTCSIPSTVSLAGNTPTNVNVDITTPNENFGGLYLLTISAVDPNSAELGYDAIVNLTVVAAPTFSVSNAGAITVKAGASTGNTTDITVTPANGFMGNVNLTCTVATSIVNANHMPTCSLSPAQVSVTGSAAVTSKLTVTTTAKTSAAITPTAKPFRLGAAIPMLAMAFLFGVGVKRKRWNQLFGALVLVCWLGMAGCGGGANAGTSGGGGSGGGGNPGTTVGGYSVVVTATDAATGKISSQTVVTLMVN